jgi:hypothetical protein
MTAAEECWYRRALDFAWLNHGLPADPVKLARIIGKNCTVNGAKAVLSMFVSSPVDPEIVISERQELEREKQQEWSRKSAVGGKKSRPPTKQRGSKKEPPLEVNGKQKGTLQFASEVCAEEELATQGGDAANQGDPVELRIWKDGVVLIKQSGLNEANARSFLGAMAKEYGKLRLAECIATTQAANVPDPLKYLVAVLQDRAGASTRAKLQVGRRPPAPEPVYNCPTCSDTGEVHQTPANAQYEWELEAKPCPNCKLAEAV